MEFDLKLPTNKKSAWKNTCEILVYHHTWAWTFNWNMNYLATNPAQASCQFVVWPNWEKWQIWQETDIQWHCWVSSWKWRNNLNRFAIWIEVVWPWFTDKQRQSVDELAKYLIKKYNIKKENVVRHKDITTRKVDIDDSFWNNKYKSWEEYKNTLFNNTEKMSKYKTIRENVIKETWSKPILNSHEWDKPLTEAEVKDLLEIAFARFAERLKW